MLARWERRMTNTLLMTLRMLAAERGLSEIPHRVSCSKGLHRENVGRLSSFAHFFLFSKCIHTPAVNAAASAGCKNNSSAFQKQNVAIFNFFRLVRSPLFFFFC